MRRRRTTALATAAALAVLTLTPALVLAAPPTAVGDAYQVNEDDALAVGAPGVLGNDSDPDNDPLTAVKDSDPVHGSLTLAADGSFAYTPAGNYNGPDSFTYHAWDGFDASQPVTVTIAVDPVNDAPVAVGESYSTGEGVQLVVPAPGVLANDGDTDGQALTTDLVASPTHGTLNLHATGGFTYTPTSNYNGADSFTYRASDGSAYSNTVTVSLSIVNQPPTAVPDAYSTNEDSALNRNQASNGVLANDSDPEGDPFTAILVGQPANGTVTNFGSNGTFRYTPAANFNGTDSFTYRATDGTSQSVITSVTITVNPVNDAPVAVGDSGTTAEDVPLVTAALSLTANDSDLETPDTGLVASLVTGASHGTVVVNGDGSYTYTPAANYSGTDSFTYRVADGNGALSNTATVSLTITPSNDAPVAVADARSTNEDVVLSGATVLGNDSDPDGQTLVAVLDTPPGRGTLTLNANGTFTYSPLLNDNGSVTFTYHASDGTFSSGPATVTITITPVNDAPIAGPDSGTTSEDTLLSVAAPGVRSNDSDIESPASSLTASIATQPAHGTATVASSGAWTYQPAANYNGSDSFTYRVSDGAAFSAPATVTLTVTPVNDAPVASGDAYQASEDVPLVVAAAAGVLADDTDVDSIGLSASLITGPSHGALLLQASGAFSYAPSADYNGPDAFSYRASDSVLQSGIVQVSLNVGAVNDPPTFILGPAPSVAEDSGLKTIPGFLTAIDPGPADESGQEASVVAPLDVASPLLFSQQPAIDAAGTLTFRPATNRSGSSLVTVNVRDDGGTANGGDDTGSLGFLITVTGTNDPPTANSDSYGSDLGDDGPRIEAGILTTLDVLANDFTLPDVGETLTIVATTKPGHGSVSIAPGGSSLTYRSTTGYAGGDSFVYTLSDGVYTDTATVFLTIADTLPPALGASTFKFVTGAQLTFKVKVRLGWSASDPGSGVRSYDVQQSTNGGASWAMLYSGTTSTSAVRSLILKTGYTYRFRARDKRNHLSAWSAPTTFVPTRYQERTSLASYSSGWKVAFISSASGNRTRYAKARGALSTFTFTGRAVSLVAPRSSSRGKAEIRVDGVLVATVNLHRSSTDARRHVWSRSWGAVGPHVVSVRVLGTIGHPRFDVDAWTVLK